MNSKGAYRALVVDDEVAVQKLLILALSRQGFECDSAGDGIQADQRLAETRYDAVVTDLRMPNKHGYALATELLKLDRPPVIVIHTSVMEPRLAKDLLARGVDDILFKPADYSFFAAKVRALVERRISSANSRNAISQLSCKETNQLQEESPADAPVMLSHLEGKLSGLSRILPISKAGLEVYNMTCTDEWEAPQIAAAIQRDPTIAAEVLRLANSAFYNPSGQRIVQLERAIVCIGQRRIGELALATNALTALTSGIVPWMDIGLAWKQSMAAGLAAEIFIGQGGHEEIEHGLLLSAIMHSLGRVVLGTLYPKHYELMVKQCQMNGESLQEQERRLFPMGHTEVVAHLLATWNVPAEVHLPLKFAMEDYPSLVRVAEPTRIKAELVKLAIFIGRIAVGQWESWDLVELPPTAVLRRLGIVSLLEVIEQTSGDVELLATFRTDKVVTAKPGNGPTYLREISYCDLSDAPFDFLGRILPAMRIKPVRCAEQDLNDFKEKVLINCVGVSQHRFAALVSHSSRDRLIVTDAERVDEFNEYGITIALPASFRRLHTACWEASRPIAQKKHPSGVAFSNWA